MEGSKRTNKLKKVNRFIGSKTKLADLGQEEIAVAGRRYLCHRYKLTYFYKNGHEKLAFTYWLNPEIPGFARFFSQARDPKTKEIMTVTQTAVS